MPTVTASALSVVSSRPGIHIPENFAAVIATGLDDVFKRVMERPSEGKQFFREIGMKKAQHKFQSHFGLGTVAQNSDTEKLPYDEKGLGFGWTLTSNTFRGAIAISKELVEDELYGTIADMQSELSESYKTSEELVMADVFNRAFGTSGAPFVCEDGMYLIDSARPQAFDQVANWSNLEATGALTLNAIYQASLNFASNTDERGQLAPLKLARLIIRPTDEKSVWEILKSDLRPTDAMNAKNFMFGRFEYTPYNYLTAANIFYLADSPKASKNELIFGNRVAPSQETWKNGDNPDVTNQRIRGRFGVGAGRPYIWRGMIIS